MANFELDTKDFDLKFDQLNNKELPEAIKNALLQTGALIIDDAINEEPRVPHKTGHLWRSQRIEIESKKGSHSLLVGFNTEYAARLHEAPKAWNWTLEGSGPKYLESKLLKFNKKYISFIVEQLNKELGK